MKLLVSALEGSANDHLKKVLDYCEDVEIEGIFDKRLGNPIYDNTQSAVMGFVDAIKQVRFFLKLQKKMVESAAHCDKVLLIDGSGFNLPLAKKIKKQYPDKEIIYYILPQAWAWRRYRIKAIQKYCDRLLSILPFECGYYRDKCRYVGHPLLDSIQEYKSDYDTDTIVFMPGSRQKEIANLMPVFRELQAKFTDYKCLLVVPESMRGAEVYGDLSAFDITHDTYDALREAKHAFICSGTATFEAALIGTPLSLCFIINKLDYKLGRMLAHIEHTGLANIILEKIDGQLMHSEFFQEDVTAQNLYNDYLQTKSETFEQKSRRLREIMGHGSSQNVAKVLQQ